MDEQGVYTFDEHWENIVDEANKNDGSNYSRMLYKQLIHGLRTGEPGALSSLVVRAFLADGLEATLNVKNPGYAGKAMKINRPTNTKGSNLNKHEFIMWYCKQCEDSVPTSANLREWKLNLELKGQGVSERSYCDWKAEAKKMFANPKSAYHLFKHLE